MLDNEYQIVETKRRLIEEYKELLKSNRQYLVLDFGYNLPIYDWFIDPSRSVEHYNVKSYTEKMLFDVAAAHKQFPEDTLRQMLDEVALRLKNISKGNVITNEGYKYIIEQALELRFVTEVEPNTTIRFLENPYYSWNKDEYHLKTNIKRELINQAINNTVVEDNYVLIENAIADYDLNQKRITKPVLSELTGLSISTVKNYLKKYSCLNEMFKAVKHHSGTVMQLKNKKYNSNKLVKRLSA